MRVYMLLAVAVECALMAISPSLTLPARQAGRVALWQMRAQGFSVRQVSNMLQDAVARLLLLAGACVGIAIAVHGVCLNCHVCFMLQTWA